MNARKNSEDYKEKVTSAKILDLQNDLERTRRVISHLTAPEGQRKTHS